MLPFRRLPPVEYVVAYYISRQKARWHGRAVGLSPEQKRTLRGYFAVEDLDRAAVARAPRLPIPRPPGYRQLGRLTGLSAADPEGVVAITFDHVVVARQELPIAILFHEMVHVVQYRVLGVRAFARHYVRGFLEHGRYELIPLEACAFELEERFLCGGAAFDVESEVRRRLG